MSSDEYLGNLYRLDGRVAVVTGATGVLGGAIARGLAAAGARVAVLGRRQQRAEEVAGSIRAAGGDAIATPADVLDTASLERVRHDLLAGHGAIDILVNAAGGNVPAAIVPPEGTFFDVSADAVRQAVELNLMGTLLPCQVFGAAMAERASGAILNISSMTAIRPLTRTLGYSAAKGAVDNFTRWLAVELVRKHGPGVRVNALAPGFFLGEQNRAMLTRADGTPTPRGQTILDHTPAGRFGDADELVGAAIWLCGPGSAFVTGVVVPVDGGFSAFAGV
ncbi:MAG TPA: SDR family oxidoreductase [Candidatus Dormibacteraeota bacterium]|nr:SDR family oxidoreductase [Candidatus Dormibacteraeota bacterium]